MRRPYQILMPLLSLFFVRVDLTDLWTLKYEVTMVSLLDGDTALVDLGKRRLKIRFLKIDAPEKGQPFWDGKGDAGLAALACAQRVAHKKTYTLVVHKQDMYGRLLGDLDNLGLELVKQGCVSLYPHAEFSSKQEKWLFIMELKKAQIAKRGVWARGGFMQPKLWRKQCDLRGRRSHRVKC